MNEIVSIVNATSEMLFRIGMSIVFITAMLGIAFRFIKREF